jgi:glycosyltransferase involved in cell wall biosynthesis
MRATTSTLRPVIVAEHASARFGGEALLPLEYFRQLRRLGVDVRMVVHSRTRRELESLLPDDHDRIHYVPDTWMHRVLWAIGRHLPDRVRVFTTGWLMHAVTERYQRQIVRQLVRADRATLVHAPTPISARMPSLLYGMGVPVIIGPLSGGMRYPPAFRYLEGFWERLLNHVGPVIADALNILMPGKRRAALLLVANQRTRDALPRNATSRIAFFVETGIDTDVWTPVSVSAASGDHELRVAYVGRLIVLKGVDLLLDAFSKLIARFPARLDILGDGPERSALERQAAALQVTPYVGFHGFRPREECRRVLADAHVLVLPSLHECGGTAVLEAMALGLPTVVTAWGGPADYVDDTYGIRVPPTSRSAFVAGIADALIQLAVSREVRETMGHAAREAAVRRFSWEARAKQMLDIYHSVHASHM